MGFGGVTTGYTSMSFHLLESRLQVNKPIEITQDILDNKCIKIEGYPLSIFGIVTEYVEEIGSSDGDLKEKKEEYKEEHPQAKFRTNQSGNIEAYLGLDFKEENEKQLDFLGKFGESGGRKTVDGATDSLGEFGGKGRQYLVIVENEGDSGFDREREVVLLPGQKYIFDRIIRDERKLKFRADNFDANKKGEYPSAIRGKAGIDVTDKNIRIKTDGLKIGDTIFITYSYASGDRHVRQSLDHKGTIGQGNTYGVAGFVGALASEVDAFDYQIRKWRVPPLPSGIDEYTTDQIAYSPSSSSKYTKDADFKLSLSDFLKAKRIEREIEKEKEEEGESEEPTEKEKELDALSSEIEGWRLSEAVLFGKHETFFAADYRGIVQITDKELKKILLPRSEIRDQEWFTEYLESLDFTYPSGEPDPDDPVDEDGFPKKTYLPSDLQKKIEHNVKFKDMEGFLFDTSEIVNSLLFDREKLHYYRPFADALKTVSKYNRNASETGVGIISLDLLQIFQPWIVYSTSTAYIKNQTVTYKNLDFSRAKGGGYSEDILDYYDLSFGIFESSNAHPRKNENCEDPVALRSYNYWSNNYDEQGIYLNKWYVQDSVLEWRPDGGTLESYWKIETPYFCGDFNRDTRVYIEKWGGNSLDNFSWIYVDTNPFVPENISCDANYNSRSLMTVFREEDVHKSLCYFKIDEEPFESAFNKVKTNKYLSHSRDLYKHTVDGREVIEPYDHDLNLITGQNRILGDSPSYSNGSPIQDAAHRVCALVKESEPEDEINNFWFTKNLLSDSWGEEADDGDEGESFGLSFKDSPPRAKIPSYWSIKSIEVKFRNSEGLEDKLEDLGKYISFYFEGEESSISNYRIASFETDIDLSSFVIKFNYYHTDRDGYLQFLGDFWKVFNIKEVNARLVRGNDQGIEEALNIDTYKVYSGQNSVVHDRQGRIMVFYANEDTANIDVAISYNDGDDWVVHKNLIRLIASETTSLPFVLKDANSSHVHLFYVLNESFLMYKRINIDNFVDKDLSIEYDVPETYEPGDYDMDSYNPENENEWWGERDYWGHYSSIGIRQEPSYFIAGNAEDPYFIDQLQSVEEIKIFNSNLSGDEVKKSMTFRFLFAGNQTEMRDAFTGSPYSVYFSGEGTVRLFMISNGKLSVKRSSDYFSWFYDIREQVIHKNYIDDKLNKGFPEEISNIQIVRNDYDKNIISLLYFYNKMLFIRHFYTNFLFSWADSSGKVHDEMMKRSLEITDADSSADPPKSRTENVPIFLVGTIPNRIKDTLIDDIEKGIPLNKSDLFIYFPYKDPDEPLNKKKNKEMVELFSENRHDDPPDDDTIVIAEDSDGQYFGLDVDTQVYAITTAKGLIRIFYRDSFKNINGIIMDSYNNPILEVGNVFRDSEVKER
jgi:hypothetical protein